MIVARPPDAFQPQFGFPWAAIGAHVGSQVAGWIRGASGNGNPTAPMPDLSGILPEPYEAYSSDPTFRSLQANFAAAYGPSFPTFSIAAFIEGDPPGDPSYARRILERIAYPGQEGLAPKRAKALTDLLDYFRARGAGAQLGPLPGGEFPISTAGFGGGSGALPLLLLAGALLFMPNLNRRKR